MLVDKPSMYVTNYENCVLFSESNNIKVLYDDMDWIKIEPGSYSLMCYWFQNIDDITFLSSTDDVIGYLETITAISVTDHEPYKPGLSEMCLVSYKGPEDDEGKIIFLN